MDRIPTSPSDGADLAAHQPKAAEFPSRRVERNRLAYYRGAATSAFWESVWDSTLRPGFFAPYAEGYLQFFEEPFGRFLPTTGRVLEAGCGTGQYVVALRARGYDCVGVDYAADTVERVRSLLPDLPIEVGDVTQMTYPSATFSAVISLGVVEHRREGPEPFLREMRRVLQDSGRLLVSVPHFNALRRARARRGAYEDDCSGLSFYQWAFTPDEFRDLLRTEGFDVLDEYDYNYQKCMLDELAWLGKLPPLLYKAIIKGCGLVPQIRSRLGHMRLYVAEKRGK